MHRTGGPGGELSLRGRPGQTQYLPSQLLGTHPVPSPPTPLEDLGTTLGVGCDSCREQSCPPEHP